MGRNVAGAVSLGGRLAVFTYSSPTQAYDPAGADDFANTFKWGK